MSVGQMAKERFLGPSGVQVLLDSNPAARRRLLPIYKRAAALLCRFVRASAFISAGGAQQVCIELDETHQVKKVPCCVLLYEDTRRCNIVLWLKVCCWQHNQEGGNTGRWPALGSVCLCKHSTLHEEEAAAVLARPDLLECWLPCLPHVPRGGEGSFNLSAGGNGSTLASPALRVARCTWAGSRNGRPSVGVLWVSSNCAADSFCATMRPRLTE